MGEYFLASAFEKVVVQKTGYVGLTGAGTQQVFLRGFLDKYGVKPEIFTREVGKEGGGGGGYVLVLCETLFWPLPFHSFKVVSLLLFLTIKRDFRVGVL